MSEVVVSRVSVRDLKTHLSEWLARAQSGEVVEVTSHRSHHSSDAGVISWNGKNPVIPPPVKLNDGCPLMSDIVTEGRG